MGNGGMVLVWIYSIVFKGRDRQTNKKEQTMIRNRIYRAMNQALTVTLITAIVATGIMAVRMTHISATVTITFGEQPKQFADAVSISDLKQFAALPMPQHKPSSH